MAEEKKVHGEAQPGSEAPPLEGPRDGIDPNKVTVSAAPHPTDAAQARVQIEGGTRGMFGQNVIDMSPEEARNLAGELDAAAEDAEKRSASKPTR
jgi:hypothetical protein